MGMVEVEGEGGCEFAIGGDTGDIFLERLE
jgi:hypothetical protein